MSRAQAWLGNQKQQPVYRTPKMKNIFIITIYDQRVSSIEHRNEIQNRQVIHEFR
jgi:hypothetical protein